MVPFNYRGLFDAMGGNAAVTSRLDSFFTDLNAGPAKEQRYLGNEPTLETPWAYAYAGAPYKTQDIVRRALTTNFKPLPEGMVGNDDLGEMSSWAVWAALRHVPGGSGPLRAGAGQPAVPGDDDHSRQRQGDHDQRAGRLGLREVRAEPARQRRGVEPRLGAGVVRGQRWHARLHPRTTANTSWGAAAADAPPSFDVGPTPARTGAVGGLASKCMDADPSLNANGAQVRIWDWQLSAAQQWTRASDGTLRALGRCLDVSGSKRDNATKVQLWDCNATGAPAVVAERPTAHWSTRLRASA